VTAISFFSAIGSLFIGFFQTWGSLFAAPLKKFDILWIIIPIYINWIVSDIYQEKRGTSFGNAITNGAVVLWVAIDWARYLVNNFHSFSKYFIVGALLTLATAIYAIVILVEGIRAKEITLHIGRIREVSYVMIMVSPLIYGIIKINLPIILTILIGLPIFYFFFEFLLNLIPDPVSYLKDEKKENPSHRQSMQQMQQTQQQYNPSNPYHPFHHYPQHNQSHNPANPFPRKPF